MNSKRFATAGVVVALAATFCLGVLMPLDAAGADTSRRD
jgi:hypothetical protein